MYGLYLDCKNTLSPRICEKLYLNSLLSDVNFVFATETGDIGAVPAHKLVLATGSSVFYEMFYGSEEDNIPIVGASIEAFREFLQFFYLNEVRLTPKNIIEVTNLCKKFKLTECITSCADTLRNTLTIDDACWVYGIALSLKQPNLVEFCEAKLKDTTIEVFESESFLECDHELLDKIITLVSSECSAIEIVNACMKWAKVKCKRIHVLRTPKNMREALGNLFEKMPFDKLTLEQLSQYTCSYKKIFTGKELKTITHKIMARNLMTKKLAEQKIKEESERLCYEHILDFDRRLPGELVPIHNSGGDIFTAFYSNKKIVLKEFYAKLHGKAKFNGEIPYDINVKQFNYAQKIVSGLATVLKESDQIHIVLPEPVTIDAVKIYFINIYTWNVDCIENDEEECWQPMLKRKIQTKHVEITFKTNFCFDSDTISRFVFVKPNIEIFDKRDWINSPFNETHDGSDEETISR